MYNYFVKSKLARNLIRLRKQKGLSQEKLAELAGISRGTVAYYESEKEKSYIENVQAIAVALNVKIEDLLESTNGSNRQAAPQIDSRTMKKIEMILSLPKEKRHMIYTMVEALTAQKGKKSHSLDPTIRNARRHGG